MSTLLPVPPHHKGQICCVRAFKNRTNSDLIPSEQKTLIYSLVYISIRLRVQSTALIRGKRTRSPIRNREVTREGGELSCLLPFISYGINSAKFEAARKRNREF